MGFINRESAANETFKFEHDDSLTADFNINHKSMDYGYLVREVLPAYVEAMGAYYMRLSEDRISGLDVSELLNDGRTLQPRADYVYFRDGVNRIWPANYWDREICRLAFSLTPEQVVNRLTGHVAEARIMMDGALITYSYDRVPDDQIALIDSQLRPLLLGKLRLA
jgi:hypothetical protein